MAGVDFRTVSGRPWGDEIDECRRNSSGDGRSKEILGSPVGGARRSRGFENMSKKTQSGQRKSLLTGASVLAAAAAAIAATPAMAQDQEDEEAIVVTGTRLVRQDFEAISPITTVGAEQLELTATLTELAPAEIWITHGREEGLLRWAEINGRSARALRLVGYDEDGGDGADDSGDGSGG